MHGRHTGFPDLVRSLFPIFQQRRKRFTRPLTLFELRTNLRDILRVHLLRPRLAEPRKSLFKCFSWCLAIAEGHPVKAASKFNVLVETTLVEAVCSWYGLNLEPFQRPHCSCSPLHLDAMCP